MKKIFNFYFSIIATLSAIVVFGGIISLIGNKSNSIFNYILNISALIGIFAVLFVIVKKLIQYFYLKTLVLRMSYNLRNLLTNCIIGIYFIFVAKQFDLLWIGIPANAAFGILILFTGLIGFPQFLKFGKDSITIYELSKKEIKYIDLLSFDYKNNMISFETIELNYELKVFSIDSNQIDKIKNIVGDGKLGNI